MAGAVNGVLGSLNDRSFYLFPNQQQADFTRAAFTVADLGKVRAAVPNIVIAFPVGLRRSARDGRPRARAARHHRRFRRLFRQRPTALRHATFRTTTSRRRRTSAVLTNRGYKRLFPDGADPIGRQPADRRSPLRRDRGASAAHARHHSGQLRRRRAYPVHDVRARFLTRAAAGRGSVHRCGRGPQSRRRKTPSKPICKHPQSQPRRNTRPSIGKLVLAVRRRHLCRA